MGFNSGFKGLSTVSTFSHYFRSKLLQNSQKFFFIVVLFCVSKVRIKARAYVICRPYQMSNAGYRVAATISHTQHKMGIINTKGNKGTETMSQILIDILKWSLP